LFPETGNQIPNSTHTPIHIFWVIGNT
jgi:hypothetical protein